MGSRLDGGKRDREPVAEVVAYDLLVDLTGNSGTFASRAEIRFRCGRAGNSSFADLDAVSVRRAELNGAAIDLADSCRRGRLELRRLSAENTLIVEADFAYGAARAGVHRQSGPDGSCVYSKAYPGGAPRMYCCFDQAGLRAPFTVAIEAPAGWSCMANGQVASRPADGGAGLWTFAPTHPIAPYLSSFCAGPFSGPAFTWEGGRHQVPITANALPAATADLEAAASRDLFQQPLEYYHRNLGPYPYGKCDFFFVPGYPGLAFGAPGLVTVADQVLTQPPASSHGLHLPIVIAHEMAHAWFGGLTAFHPPDGWLEEAIATYISRQALAEANPGAALWEEDVSQTLPDHTYAGNAATIRQLEQLIGRQSVLDGLRDLLRRHTHGSASKADLVRCWSRAAERDLRPWAVQTLLPT